MASDRKTSFKLPPTIIRDNSQSQRSRREKALEEQKRRRAERFDLSRQLDGFADLNLAESDEDEDGQKDPNPDGIKVVHGGLAAFASTLPKEQEPIPTHSPLLLPSSPSEPKKKGKKKRVKVKKDKPNEWADKIMYAELLEMVEDDPSTITVDGSGSDGLPEDLETAWVAVAPVPVGKRCLAITRDSSGYNGVEPNTTLRSRVLGKPLLPWFPSNLPPNTILDCILDENWRHTGVLHVLDVLKWKGQDIAECETPFRFWWRDTRIGELPFISPPPSGSQAGPSTQMSYRFPYPTTLLPVPYHTDTSLENLLSQIIPVARTARPFLLKLPPSGGCDSTDMQVEILSFTSTTNLLPVQMLSDGLLLYVAEASYESGTSPLSNWIPLKNYDATRAHSHGQEDMAEDTSPDDDTPINKFERLVRCRMLRRPMSSEQYPSGCMDTDMSG
ncbi:hypothetical protein D9758_009312 [Tetrapyrgos nigripes]|uniref:Snurportin-1 n=1 Tax=Tetrapyrgos nigripes TaxID=182062 RepID=A0A8H5LPH4_9AGAR|nr:hypothetical protein D9758_009312 [Tetrapyrgos nigripes]